MVDVHRRLGALQEPRFRLLWTAQSLSSIGDTMVPIAVAFAAIKIGGSPTAVGLVLAANLVPRAGLMLVGGVWGDRLPRQRVMLASDLVRCASQSLGALLLLTGTAHLWQLAVIAAIHGGAAAFFVPASSGLVPETVTPARLQQANATLSLSRHSVGVIGPAISGLLVAAFGPGWVYGVDAVTFAASAWFLFQLPILDGAGVRARNRFLTDLVTGWRELTARTWLWTSVAYFSVGNLALAPFFVLGPIICQRELHGARDWGLIMTGGAIGSVVGGLVALRARPQRPLVVGYLAVSACALLPALLVRPFPVLVIAAAAVLAMATLNLSTTLWVTTLQEGVPREAISRVSAYDWLGSLIFMPAGLALAGPLSGAIGITTTLWLSASILIGSNLLVVAMPSIRAVRRSETELAAPVVEPPPVGPEEIARVGAPRFDSSA